MVRNSEKTRALRKAKEAQVLAKKIEAERIKNGWIWMSLDRKTKTLVHPSKIENKIQSGWKRSSGS